MTLGHACGALLLTAALAGAAHAGQREARAARDTGTAPAAAVGGTGVIRGRVTTGDGAAPVRRAEVSALSSGVDFQRVLTDDRGRFELTGLGAGTWYLSVAKTGYLTQPFGARRPFDSATPIVLAAGQQFTADVPLTRASAIAGRVYDEYGEPLTGVRIGVMRARMAQQRRYLQPIGTPDVTDDTGAFRIHSLPPGEYYVTGSLRMAPADSVVQNTYSPTYYPGTGNFVEAQRVVLSPGAEAAIEFPLLPFRTARVSGLVVTSGGAPASAFLNLASDADELGVPLGVGGVTKEDGTFMLPDVPPGTYTLTATLRDGSGGGSEAASIPIAVYGDDVTGLTLVTSKPGSLRGTIVPDTGVTRRLPASLDIVTRTRRGPATFATATDGRFELTAPQGLFHLVVEPPDGWSVKAIVVRGTDATDTAIEVSGERDVPVRIVLSDRVTEVSGTITGGDPGRPPAVIVFPEDPARWNQATRYLRAVPTDERGRFRIRGLPANTRYLAAAVDALEEGEGEDPEFLARVKDFAVAFGLAEGEQRVIAVPLLRR